MSKFPYLPFCVDAYRNDTPHLTLEQHGAYVTLLMLAWRSPNCRLPDDDVKLARMLGVTAKKWAALKPVVMDFWTLKDGFWSQGRLEKERDFVSRRAKTSAGNGKQGGRPKSLPDNETTNPAGYSQVTQQEPSGKAPNTLHLTPGVEGKAVEPPESYPEKPETDIRTDASRSAPARKGYFLESGVVRLNERDFRKWEASFPNTNVAAELIGAAGYIEREAETKNGSWFHIAAGLLAKRDREARLAVEKIKAEAIAVANAPKRQPSGYCP